MRLSLCFTILSLALAVGVRADFSRRLFDFTPVSADNPPVATIDGTVQIPLSELRSYRDAERLQAITDPATFAQKRAVLDDLIKEYLFVDEAYRTGVVESPGFARQMEATQTMVLTDFMAMRAADEKAAAPATAPEDGEAGAALAEKLFEAAHIEVSNESYEILKRAAKAVDEVAETLKPGSEKSTMRLQEIVATTPEAVLVKFEEKSISVHQILALYAGLPVEKRPAVATQDGFIAMIKPLILPQLMALEARKRGIAIEPEFQHKIIQNRNALLRFQTQGQVERQANELLQRAGIDAQLLAWFDGHRADYAMINEQGERRPATYAEARARVEGDYSVALRDRLLAEKAQALLKDRQVVVDETVLGRL